MIKRKLFVVFSLFFMLCVNVAIKAQSSTAIVLNEYSASNVGTPVDNYGQQSDWVEIRNHHTQQVNLSGYYLSNDPMNPLKWKIPPGFVMGVETYSVVWLSGRNTVSNGQYHANFTLDQCKNQYLILSNANGVRRDCVFVQRTKAGHSWGRVDPDAQGVGAWRLYTSHSFLFPNPTTNNYRGYAPTPKIVISPAQTIVSNTNPRISAGGFSEPGANLVYFKLEGPLRYDTVFHPCYNIYYTTDGSYPVVGVNQVIDSLTPSITVDIKATIIRAIAVVNPSLTNCPQDYLPSFCETNTFFADAEYNNFKEEFGVVSIAIDPADQPFFNSNGLPANTPIHVEYYDKKKQISEGYGLINRPPNESWLTKQRGFDITIDDKQGFGCNFEGNIFNVEGLGTSSRTVFPTLHLSGGDFESASEPLNGVGTNTAYGTGLRDVFMQTLSAKYNLNVNPLHAKPVVVFINGKYDGVFTLREKYDKYYENYYNKQSKDSLDLAYYHNIDGYVSYPDGSVSRFQPTTAFKTKVYDVVTTRPIGPGSTGPYYKAVMNELDKSSLIDYMIVNSYAMNSDLWSYNVAYAKGGQVTKPGGKWHYYLWNMPTIFNFTNVAISNFVYTNSDYPLCYVYSNPYAVSPIQAGNSHGAIMKILMNPSGGNTEFQTDYKNRYQDLVNTALKCENVINHYQYIYDLYKKEMNYHEDPTNLGTYATALYIWDTNMARLKRVLDRRCFAVANAFSSAGCYGLRGPYNLVVNIEPEGAGSVKLNSIVLDSYPWTGSYYQENVMSFKAVPSNTTFTFDHWEFKNNQVLNARPLSLDSIAISFAQPEEVIAVFTDKSADIQSGINVPTGFTPNGDGNNDIFKPLGSARFATEYEMTIWNRWGQEVFRSVDPENGWDGHYKGQDAITGVYAYIIKYKNIYNEAKTLKGNVTLTR